MSIMQVIFGQVQSAMGTVNAQKGAAEGVMSMLKGLVPKVQAGWVGDDADAFTNQVNSMLLPAIGKLIAAIAGMSFNLDMGLNIIGAADKAAKGIADKIGGVFQKIGSIF